MKQKLIHQTFVQFEYAFHFFCCFGHPFMSCAARSVFFFFFSGHCPLTAGSRLLLETTSYPLITAFSLAMSLGYLDLSNWIFLTLKGFSVIIEPKQQDFSLKVLRCVFAALQPGLGWSSVGSYLSNQPPTEDVFDSLGFLMKWKLSAYIFWTLARDRSRQT